MSWMTRLLGWGPGPSRLEIDVAREEAELALNVLKFAREALQQELTSDEAQAERRLELLARQAGGMAEDTPASPQKLVTEYERARETCRKKKLELIASNPLAQVQVLLYELERVLDDVQPSPERTATVTELSGLYAALGAEGPADECRAELTAEGRSEEIDAMLRGLEELMVVGPMFPEAWAEGMRAHLFAEIEALADERLRLDARVEVVRILAQLASGEEALELFASIDDAWFRDQARTLVAERFAESRSVDWVRRIASDVQALDLRARASKAVAVAEARTGSFERAGECAAAIGDEAQRAIALQEIAVVRSARGALDDDALSRLDEPVRSAAQCALVERLCAEGRLEDAASRAAEVEDLDWRDDAWSSVAVAALKADGLERARSALTEIEQPGVAANGLDRLGWVCRKSGDEESARALFAESAQIRAREIQPGNDYGLTNLSLALDRAGDRSAAWAVARSIGQPEVHARTLQYLSLEQGERHGFAAVEDLAREGANSFERAHVMLGGARALVGRWFDEEVAKLEGQAESS